MMKKILTIIFVLSLMMISLNAQITNYPYLEGFNGTAFPPAGWIINPTNSTPSTSWYRSVDGPYGTLPVAGAALAASRSWYNGNALNPNNWLISPQFAVPEEGLNLIYYIRSAHSNYPDHYGVFISTTGTTTGTGNGTVVGDFTRILDENAPANWTQKILDLSDYAGELIYIAFRHYNSSDQEVLMLDEVVVGSVPENPEFLPATNLVATGGDSFITLSWTAPVTQGLPMISKYEVYRNGTHIYTTQKTTYKDPGLVNGATYEYAVKTLYVLPTGISELSEPTFGTPVGNSAYAFSPSNLVASATGQDVTLNWDVPEYKVEMPDGSFFTQAASDPAYVLSVDGEWTFVHRYTVANLNAGTNPLAGKMLTGASFITEDESGSFSIKVWTGGSVSGNNYNPGTLRINQLIPQTSITMEDWIDVAIINPIEIPSDQEMWIGFHVVTAGGSAPITDQGPANVGLGNLVCADGQWGLMSDLGPTLTYNWILYGMASNVASLDLAETTYFQPSFNDFEAPKASNDFSHKTIGIQNVSSNHVSYADRSATRNTRNFIGYNVYRGTDMLNLSPISETIYLDNDVPVGPNTYSVTAVYEVLGESAPVNATINIYGPVETFPWLEGFESAIFPPGGWSRASYGITPTSLWTNEAQNNQAHSGQRYAASRSGSNPALIPDNWLVTPKINLPVAGAGNDMRLTFWVAAQHATNFRETIEVLVSTTNSNVDSFTEIFTTTMSNNSWQEITLPLQQFEGQSIFIAFRHYQTVAQMTLKLDDVTIREVPTSEVGIITEPVKTRLVGNYPNPFNPETSISFSVSKDSNVSIDIFNIKGQKVRSLVNDTFKSGTHQVVWNGTDNNGKSVGSGMYFYRMNNEDFTSTKRMLLMK